MTWSNKCDLLDSAVHFQFTKYFEGKGVIPDINDTNQKEAFLYDFYPGMKDMPNEFVQLMVSPDPEKTINIQANLLVKTNVSNELDALPGNQYVYMQGQATRMRMYKLTIFEFSSLV